MEVKSLPAAAPSPAGSRIRPGRGSFYCQLTGLLRLAADPAPGRAVFAASGLPRVAGRRADEIVVALRAWATTAISRPERGREVRQAQPSATSQLPSWLSFSEGLATLAGRQHRGSDPPRNRLPVAGSNAPRAREPRASG